MGCILESLCNRCDGQRRPFLPLDFGFHSFQLYSGVFLSIVSIPLCKPPSFPLLHLHYAKNCKCFYVLWAIFSSLLQRSSVIELLFLDLEVSQVSFPIIEENPIFLDSRLHYYSCIWFKLVVFQVSKESFQFQIAKCHHCLHFVLKETC